ncbi:MAG: hypothetical protein JWO36_2653 [Myxococcales bacterium]|nr:hypothetical protein [Myxococcales bacterium]
MPPITRPSHSLRSRYFNPFRLASYLLILFTIGHTLGAVIATPRFGSGSDAVVSAMKTVHVTAQSADCTWYGFYRGFGAMISIYFVFSIVLTWHLGGLSARDRRALAPVTWALFATYVGNAVIGWVYFFPTPQIFSTIIAVLLGLGCMNRQQQERANE